MSESPEGPDVSVSEPAAAETHEAAPHGDDEIHMPPNSWWPLVTAIGITISLVGVLFLDLPFVLAVGVLIGVGGILMWIVDARKEYTELH